MLLHNFIAYLPNQMPRWGQVSPFLEVWPRLVMIPYQLDFLISSYKLVVHILFIFSYVIYVQNNNTFSTTEFADPPPTFSRQAILSCHRSGISLP